MSLKPLRDFIIVSATKTDEKTDSGLLYKPGIIDEKVVNGKVLAVGSGHLMDNGTVVSLEVKVDDTILFNKQMAIEVKHKGDTLYLLREDSIFSVVS